MKDERRKSPRVKLEKPVAASVRTYASGQVVEVSAGGLLMRVRKKLPAGTVYVMCLAFADGEVKACGTVRRCWLVGFETNEEADRVRVYHVALEFEKPIPEIVGRFRPGDALQIHMESTDDKG
jgi:hypothetical protein